jgi:hypothetical protein
MLREKLYGLLDHHTDISLQVVAFTRVCIIPFYYAVAQGAWFGEVDPSPVTRCPSCNLGFSHDIIMR